MARHGDKRSRPDQLLPGTLRVISVRMDYGTGADDEAWATLATDRAPTSPATRSAAITTS